MGFMVGASEIKVTADGLIHLAEFVMGVLGVSREAAMEEIAGMAGSGVCGVVRCFRRGEDTLVTSGGAEAVLAQLVKMGRLAQAPSVMPMRCFMSQNGPFAPRIQSGTVPVSFSELCEPAPQQAPMSDTDWASTVFIEQGPPDQPPPLNRHRTRLTDLELDQLEGATEMRALEGKREHYGRVYEWYRELCADDVIDEEARAVFRGVLLDMLPACGRCWTDRRAREAWRKDLRTSSGI
jgi:hypothetical protein